MIRIQDIYWAAGFLEGEGCFTLSRAACMITASQVQREPLERLQHLFGGSLKRYHPPSKQGSKARPYHLWQLYGVTARGVMMTLYPLMSPRRQTAILAQLHKWKTFVPTRRSMPTHCPHGHVYTFDNTYTYPDGRHGCKACATASTRRYQAKRQQAAEELRGFIDGQRPLATHCRNGHAFTPENTYTSSKGRECRVCRYITRHNAYIAKRDARGGSPRAAKHSRTHCPQGHEYTEANSYIAPASGTRNCRLCSKQRAAEYRARNASQ